MGTLAILYPSARSKVLGVSGTHISVLAPGERPLGCDTVGIGVLPYGIPIALRRCVVCGHMTNNWFKTDRGILWFMCGRCETPEPVSWEGFETEDDIEE